MHSCKATTYSLAAGLLEPSITHCRVEYFGQRMEGFVFTEHGWVQSYGSRYVRPPIIHGDVSRPHAMTTKEFQYAQSLTQKPVKGMLTGKLLLHSAVSFPAPRAYTSVNLSGIAQVYRCCTAWCNTAVLHQAAMPSVQAGSNRGKRSILLCQNMHCFMCEVPFLRSCITICA